MPPGLCDTAVLLVLVRLLDALVLLVVLVYQPVWCGHYLAVGGSRVAFLCCGARLGGTLSCLLPVSLVLARAVVAGPAWPPPIGVPSSVPACHGPGHGFC